MEIDPGYKYKEKFRAIQWYMIESKDFISNIVFRLKNENGRLASLNGQPITFGISDEEV